MDVVWLKRDVRLVDHEPLFIAGASGRNFMLLYMYEPDQLFHETVHGSHIAFVNEGLDELDKRLQKLSGRREPLITTRKGEATDILTTLHSTLPIARLLSHEETGHNMSYDRDKRVSRWCCLNNIPWVEVPQATVVRGLSLRDPSWRDICNAQVESFLMVQPQQDPFGYGGDAKRVLSRIVCADTNRFLTAHELGLPGDVGHDRPDRQHGGESHALELLSTFLNSRGEKYAGSGTISSPNSAWIQCSRLSPYYSWGHISVRTVVHAVKAKQQSAKSRWAKSLEAYMTRLEWRRTRIQDFEMRCWMEHKSVFHHGSASATALRFGLAMQNSWATQPSNSA
jgi:deoxyribodipyrimidine photo-lyase